MGLRFAYVTNGLTGHRLFDALSFLAEEGYAGVALTLDHSHLDPLAPRLAARVAALSRRLAKLRLAVVIETGANFILDPRRKHEPSLLSTAGSDRRLHLLERAITIASDLRAEAVSFWSGVRPADVNPEMAFGRFRGACEKLVRMADDHGVTLGLEPEPGMLVATIEDFESFSAALGEPPRLGMTLDLGHCHSFEDVPVAACIRRAGPRLVNVHIEDARRGTHEHLDFGEGEIAFPEALAALGAVDYRGLVCVELSRHSHVAHQTVPRARSFLHVAERAGAAL